MEITNYNNVFNIISLKFKNEEIEYKYVTSILDHQIKNSKLMVAMVIINITWNLIITITLYYPITLMLYLICQLTVLIICFLSLFCIPRYLNIIHVI